MACHPELRVTLQGERIHFCRILFFVFLMQFGFGERRLSYRLRYTLFLYGLGFNSEVC